MATDNFHTIVRDVGRRPQESRLEGLDHVRSSRPPGGGSETKPVFVTKAEAVAAYLRDGIVSGRLKPGERLILRTIARELDVSEIPVRDALTQLHAEGLVTMRPHAGASVATLNRQQFADLFEIRVVCEALAARQAAYRATPADIEKLLSLVEQMDRCIEHDDAEGYGDLNREFNRVLHAASQNATLLEFIDRLAVLTARAKAVWQWDPTRLSRSNREHRKMIELLEQGDGAGLEELVRRHRESGLRAFIGALDSMPAAQ